MKKRVTALLVSAMLAVVGIMSVSVTSTTSLMTAKTAEAEKEGSNEQYDTVKPVIETIVIV